MKGEALSFEYPFEVDVVVVFVVAFRSYLVRVLNDVGK